jgi:hypothetical protein
VTTSPLRATESSTPLSRQSSTPVAFRQRGNVRGKYPLTKINVRCAQKNDKYLLEYIFIIYISS